MYLDHFKLHEHPFRLTPDSEFLYMSSAHARAKAYMDYAVWSQEGFVVITGEIGCGKTTLLQKLLSELKHEEVVVAKIFQTQLNEVEFLQALLVEFGMNPFSMKKVEMLDVLNTFLIEQYTHDRQPILIVDDAHNLDFKVLEEIRMLASLETDKEKILHVILVGQPQLNDRLESPELEQLLQRVRLRFHLRPLSESETAEYVNYRLKVAGAQAEKVFLPETISTIYTYTGGVPRLINALCDTAMACAFVDSRTTIDRRVIAEAAEELQWLPYAKRINIKRNKERASRGVRKPAGRDEQERQLASLEDRLGRVGSMVPEMNLISNKIASIERLLEQILAALEGKPLSAPVEKKRGGR